MKCSHKRGFTLVELSIVLVIIGLLIGGILVAQSMIKTAKIQSFIRQLDQIDAAVSNFKTKFNALPGDYSGMGCVAASNKCNNGLYEDSNGHSYRFDSEIANFFPNLQLNGFLLPGGTLTATVTGQFSVAGPIQNSPTLTIGNKTTGIIVSTSTGFTQGANMYYVQDWSGITASSLDFPASIQPSIPGTDALAIDTKIDDGLTGSGTSPQGYMAGLGMNSGCQVPDADGNPTAQYRTDKDALCTFWITMMRYSN